MRQAGLPLSNRHKAACRSAGFNPNRNEFVLHLPRGEMRAQSVGTTTAGGHLRPTTLAESLEVALKEWNACRQVATIIRTEGGGPLDMPTVNDTTNVGTLLAENTTVGDPVDFTFGKTTYGAYKFQSGLVLMSNEFVQDEAVNFAKMVGGLLGERIGRGTEGYFTTGTGSSQPGGIVTGSALGKTAASATAIAGDELMDLQHSVDPAYRNRPGSAWMMHDGIAAVVRKLKDGASRYLWDFDGLRNGMPPLLLGKPVVINQSMQATVATGTKTILFGDLSTFIIRDAGPIRIRRLEERYADIDQTGYVAFQRVDSKVLNAGTNPIKHLIQA